jgi:aspartate-semialdehyde dehydrogenase
MSLHFAERSGEARVAVVGAPTAEGVQLREALEQARVPGARVDLYGISDGEALIGEYAGEARLIQEPDLDEIARHEVIFLCERGAHVGRVLLAAPPDALIIDLKDSLPKDVPRVHLDINPQRVGPGARGRFSVPHPLSLLLAELLHPLDHGPGLAEAAAVVVRPAADYGQEGVEELRRQTVQLLSFAEVPVDTFGRQLAFNIIPQGGAACSEADLESRVVSGVRDLLGWTANRLTVKFLTAPVFYGHGIQLRFRLRETCTLDQLRTLLAPIGLRDPAAADAARTPLDVIGEARTGASDLTEDGLGGFWLWVVAGEAGTKGAQQAVRLATHLGALA